MCFWGISALLVFGFFSLWLLGTAAECKDISFEVMLLRIM
jgi:hypothetical protein